MKDRDIPYSLTLCDDGVYRWRYDVKLLKNPTIFLLLWKIFFCIFVGIFAIVFLAEGFSAERIAYNLKFLGYFLIGMTIVTGLGYLLYAAMMGWRYCVVFEMDENGVNHRQIHEQAKRAKKLVKATVFAGVASGRLTTVGVGMNAARTEMYSDFKKVKKVIACPSRDLIKLNTPFSHNQIYANKYDYLFVKNFLLAHCDHAK